MVITLNLEAGLITPPVGPNTLRRPRASPPQIPLSRVLHGSIPFHIAFAVGHRHPVPFSGDRHLAAVPDDSLILLS
ncbi:MAG: hypothetical protein U5R30_14945 [Deltaproteobacteria bacterium]|nr:hypothetical protein [Deltaproteobacteria bacterium]